MHYALPMRHTPVPPTSKTHRDTLLQGPVLTKGQLPYSPAPRHSLAKDTEQPDRRHITKPLDTPHPSQQAKGDHFIDTPHPSQQAKGDHFIDTPLPSQQAKGDHFAQPLTSLGFGHV